MLFGSEKEGKNSIIFLFLAEDKGGKIALFTFVIVPKPCRNLNALEVIKICLLIFSSLELPAVGRTTSFFRLYGYD
jgi:hypothetical protein